MQNKIRIINQFLTFTLFLLVLSGTTALSAQDKPQKLFESEDTLQVRLHGPWRDIEKKPKYQGKYPGKIEWTDELGNSNSLDIEVETGPTQLAPIPQGVLGRLMVLERWAQQVDGGREWIACVLGVVGVQPVLWRQPKGQRAVDPVLYFAA